MNLSQRLFSVFLRRGVGAVALIALAQQLYAAPFFAPPVREGELSVKLHPTEGWGSGTTSVVTFKRSASSTQQGKRFPRGSRC